MGLTGKQAIAKMLEPVKKRVSFKYPGREGTKRGILKDRAIIRSGDGGEGVKYWDVVDLIEFPGEWHPLWMRIGYYRQVGDQMRWASQTTIAEPLETWKRLLVEAARDKDWFRQLIRDVASESCASHCAPSQAVQAARNRTRAADP